MARIEKATALQTEISANEVAKRIYSLRGLQVMLDQDLAQIYDVETKVLKQAAKRNIDRFPEDFMWRTTEDELESLRSQSVTQNVENLINEGARPKTGSQFVTENLGNREVGRRGTRYAPFAFTEHGVAMLSSVLNSKRAIQVNISIIRIFIQLRREQRSQLDVIPKLESLESMFKQRFDRLELSFKNQVPATRALQAQDPVSVIQNAVARHFGLTAEGLKSSSRTQAISLPRQIAIFLTRKNLSMGFAEIGQHFGGRDHTTIMHAYRKILSNSETSAMIRTAVDVLGNDIEQQQLHLRRGFSSPHCLKAPACGGDIF